MIRAAVGSAQLLAQTCVRLVTNIAKACDVPTHEAYEARPPFAHELADRKALGVVPTAEGGQGSGVPVWRRSPNPFRHVARSECDRLHVAGTLFLWFGWLANSWSSYLRGLPLEPSDV